MKFLKITLVILLTLYVSTIFAFQLSPDSGVSQFVGTIFGEHFATMNAFSLGVVAVTGMITSFLSDIGGLFKLMVALIVAVLGAVAGWFLSQGIFVDMTLVESVKVGWAVAGGSTLIHAIIKEIGILGVISSIFKK